MRNTKILIKNAKIDGKIKNIVISGGIITDITDYDENRNIIAERVYDFVVDTSTWNKTSELLSEYDKSGEGRIPYTSPKTSDDTNCCFIFSIMGVSLLAVFAVKQQLSAIFYNLTHKLKTVNRAFGLGG